MILKILLIIHCHIVKLHMLIVKKAKLNFAKTKLEREAWLAMIISRQSLTELTISSRNNKEIRKTPCKVLGLAPQFVSLPHRQISKISQNLFWYLNLYKLQHFKDRKNIYRD